MARKEARKSLIEFTRYTLPNYEANWHHIKICEALEAVERGEIKRLVIEAPPRHGKSELASRRFPAWYLGRNPDKQIITSTYNADFAADFGREVRNIIASDDFCSLFPGVGLRPDSKAANRWHTNHNGIYIAAGVGSSTTGRGADLLLIDDPFKDRKEADSPVRQKDVWDWYRSTALTRLMKGGAVVVIATRWHELDLTGQILERAEESGEHWEVIKLPALSDGRALWPERYPVEYLETLRATMGSRDWLSLYQQTPTADEGVFFKRDWFKRYQDAPTNLNIYMSGDFAVTHDEGDYTEIAVWGVDQFDNIYALDWWRGKTESAIWIEKIIQFIQQYKPMKFTGEQGPIRRAVEPFLRRRMREENAYTVLDWMPTGSGKEANARAFQALAENGRVHFPKTEWAEIVLDQLMRFPAGRYDDAVDTCSLFARGIHKVWEAQPPRPKKETPVIAPPKRIRDFEPDDAFSRFNR